MDDPLQPTSHPPGSEGKIEILRQRALLGLPLFLAGDEVDCTGALCVRRCNPVSNDTARKMAIVAEKIRAGVPYREISRQLGCSASYVAALAKMERQATA